MADERPPGPARIPPRIRKAWGIGGAGPGGPLPRCSCEQTLTPNEPQPFDPYCPVHGRETIQNGQSADVIWPETRALAAALRMRAADHDNYRAALEAIVRHADMPDGESWEQAYIEVTTMARDALDA